MNDSELLISDLFLRIQDLESKVEEQNKYIEKINNNNITNANNNNSTNNESLNNDMMIEEDISIISNKTEIDDTLISNTNIPVYKDYNSTSLNIPVNNNINSSLSTSSNVDKPDEELTLARTYSKGITNSSIILSGERIDIVTNKKNDNNVEVLFSSSNDDIIIQTSALPSTSDSIHDKIKLEVDNVLLQIKEFEDKSLAIEEKQKEEFAKLLEEFMGRGAILFETFESKKEPMKESISKFRSPLNALLIEEYVEIPAEKFGVTRGYVQSSFNEYESIHYDSNYSITSAFYGITASKTAKKFPDFKSYIQNYLNEKSNEANKKIHEREKEERQKKQEKLLEEVKEKRANLAINELMPMLPQLNFDQCIRALELNQDNIEKTMIWVFEQPEETLWEKLNTIAPVASSSKSSKPFGNPLQLERNFSSQAAMLKVTLKITNFSEETGIVDAIIVLDRNRIPVDTKEAVIRKIPLADLFVKFEARILCQDEIDRAEKDINERVPVITFQILNEEEFCPISITPPIKLSDYKMDFDSHSRVLTSCHHRIDGRVLFRGVLDEGFGLVDSQSPIEIYTQVVNQNNLNLVHMHIHDINDEITFDRVNLTGTDRTVEDLLNANEFKRDASGKVLTYKVVVKDDCVVAILYRKGDSIERALFIEHKVPLVGTLVHLPDNSLGVVKVVPTGMIVSKDEVGIDVVESSYEKVSACVRKHPVEMHGFIDVEIIFENGMKVYPGKLSSIPICKIKFADEADQMLSLSANVAWENLKKEELINVTASLETLVNAPITIINGAMSVSMNTVEELKNKMTHLQSLPNVGDSVDSARIRRILASMRAFAVEYRNVSSKIVLTN